MSLPRSVNTDQHFLVKNKGCIVIVFVHNIKETKPNKYRPIKSPFTNCWISQSHKWLFLDVLQLTTLFKIIDNVPVLVKYQLKSLTHLLAT